jgi:hypothetical protein
MMLGWMPSVGSSSSSSLGRVISARAMAQLLLLAARQVAAAAVAHVLEHREQLVDVIRNPLCSDARQAGKAGLQVLRHRQQREDVAALRHIADALGCELHRRGFGQRFAVQRIRRPSR